MTAAFTSPIPLEEIKVITCDLCNHQYSYDVNVALQNNAAAKCPSCSFNQTTVSKPRKQDLVAFAAPIVVVYVVTIVALLINR